MSNPSGPVILLVEDNQTIREAFRVLLEEHGYRVLEAGTGEEALSVAGSHSPDLVLMDLGLPDMGGLEVTRRMKADSRTSGAAVVALTGRALDTDQAACIEAGCAGFLPKPIDTEQLLTRIPEFLALRGK